MRIFGCLKIQRRLHAGMHTHRSVPLPQAPPLTDLRNAGTRTSTPYPSTPPTPLPLLLFLNSATHNHNAPSNQPLTNPIPPHPSSNRNCNSPLTPRQHYSLVPSLHPSHISSFEPISCISLSSTSPTTTSKPPPQPPQPSLPFLGT